MDSYMEKRPKVSVVTPTYNRADFIREAVDSVLSQSFRDLEMIVVDDGSRDNTRDVLASCLDDGRLHYVFQENQGQSVARNKGIRAARGEYICFLDSDNYWLPGKLEASVRFMDAHPDVDILYGDNISIDEEGRIISKDNMKRHSGRITGLLLHDNFISNNTVMVRRECFEQLGGFNEKDRLAEDYELWLRMSTRYTFHYLPEYMAAYRVMDDQISSDKDKRFWANERILLKFLETYPDAVTPGERRRGLSKFYTRKGRYELSVKRRRDALKDGGRALASDPFWQGPWRLLAKILLAR